MISISKNLRKWTLQRNSFFVIIWNSFAINWNNEHQSFVFKYSGRNWSFQSFSSYIHKEKMFTHELKQKYELDQLVVVLFCELYSKVDMKRGILKLLDQFCRESNLLAEFLAEENVAKMIRRVFICWGKSNFRFLHCTKFMRSLTMKTIFKTSKKFTEKKNRKRLNKFRVSKNQKSRILNIWEWSI